MSLNNGQGGGVGEDNLTPTGGGGGGGLLQVSSHGDGRRMFLGLTFSILGFFSGYENLAILFLGGLIHGGVCISQLQNTNIKFLIYFSCHIIKCVLENFKAWKFSVGFFGVLLEALGIFLGFDFTPI